MRSTIKKGCLVLCAVLLTGLSSASALSLNSYYAALGSIQLFDLNGVASTQVLENGSYIQFAGNGDFNYRLDTAVGVVNGKQNFNVAQFLTGAGDLALTSPAGISLGNGYTANGTFTPDLGVTNFVPFTFIASAMPNQYRLSSANGSFTIWNRQFSSTGLLLGATDFWLTTGAQTNVPEPMTLGLLGAGLLGAVARRKKALI